MMKVLHSFDGREGERPLVWTHVLIYWGSCGQASPTHTNQKRNFMDFVVCVLEWVSPAWIYIGMEMCPIPVIQLFFFFFWRKWQWNEKTVQWNALKAQLSKLWGPSGSSLTCKRGPCICKRMINHVYQSYQLHGYVHRPFLRQGRQGWSIKRFEDETSVLVGNTHCWSNHCRWGGSPPLIDRLLPSNLWLRWMAK